MLTFPTHTQDICESINDTCQYIRVCNLLTGPSSVHRLLQGFWSRQGAVRALCLLSQITGSSGNTQEKLVVLCRSRNSPQKQNRKFHFHDYNSSLVKLSLSHIKPIYTFFKIPIYVIFASMPCKWPLSFRFTAKYLGRHSDVLHKQTHNQTDGQSKLY